MDANPESPTICRRFINFMLSMSIRYASSCPIPVENGSSEHKKSSFKSIANTSDFDIMVEFRHTDLEADRASVHSSKKVGLISGNERTVIRKIPKKKEGINQSSKKKDGFQIQQKTGRTDQVKELKDLEILNGTDSGMKSLKTRTPEQESVNLLADQAIKQKPLRPLMPLLRVPSDINEQSDAFIQTRMEAIRKSYHLDNK